MLDKVNNPTEKIIIKLYNQIRNLRKVAAELKKFKIYATSHEISRFLKTKGITPRKGVRKMKNEEIYASRVVWHSDLVFIIREDRGTKYVDEIQAVMDNRIFTPEELDAIHRITYKHA